MPRKKEHYNAEIFIVSLKLLKRGILKEQINLNLIKMYAISSAGASPR